MCPSNRCPQGLKSSHKVLPSIVPLPFARLFRFKSINGFNQWLDESPHSSTVSGNILTGSLPSDHLGVFQPNQTVIHTLDVVHLQSPSLW